MEIALWKEQVLKASGHEFLDAGFAELLAALVSKDLSSTQAAESFLAVAAVLGQELHRPLNSLRRCEPIVEKWVRSRSRLRIEPRGIVMPPSREWEQEQQAFNLISERWGRYLQNARECGAYQVRSDTSRPPSYRFKLELRPPWQAYGNRCVAAFSELIEAYQSGALLIPVLGAEVAAGWFSALYPQEFHIGRGALIATLEHGLDLSALARALATTGFQIDPGQHSAFGFYSNPPKPLYLGLFTHADDEVLRLLLHGVAKGRSEAGKSVLLHFQRDPKAQVRELAGRLLSEHFDDETTNLS